MEKLMVTHRLSLDMSSQAVQATITLAQYDTATHRLIVSLRNGAEVVELPPGSYAAIAVQNPDAEVDVLDSVTVYGHNSVYPDCIVYDVSAYITQNEGFHEACFEVTHVDNDGLKLLSSPRIAFVVKPDILRSSDVEKTPYYGAVVNAQAKALAAQAAAEAAQAAAEAVGVVESVTIQEDGKLTFIFEDGREITTEQSVKGEPGDPGKDGENGEDYVLTEADKTEIADIVLAFLPVAEGASF